MNGNQNKVTDKEIIADIVAIYKASKKDSISSKDYHKNGGKYRHLVFRRFGTWEAALKKAGIESNTISKDKLIADVINVSKNLKKRSITLTEYKQNGKYSDGPVYNLFGSWANLLKDAGLEQNIHSKKNTDEYSVTSLLDDVLRVSRILNKQAITMNDYKRYGKYGLNTIRRMGSWADTHRRAGLNEPLKRGGNSKIDKDMILSDIKETALLLKKSRITEKEYIKHGNFSMTTVKRVLGRWHQVLNEAGLKSELQSMIIDPVKTNSSNRMAHKTNRNPSNGLRLKVLKRDRFQCVYCGKSPSKDIGIELEIDHVIPWSKGGETVIENLQTLCKICNSGKSNELV